MTKQLVEVVSTFNGAERRVIGRARTNAGTEKLLRCASVAGEGWGARVRGSKAALESVGAYQIDTADTGEIAMVLPVDFRRQSARVYFDCVVV